MIKNEKQTVLNACLLPTRPHSLGHIIIAPAMSAQDFVVGLTPKIANHFFQLNYFFSSINGCIATCQIAIPPFLLRF
jgi:hypothetical protein